MACRTWLGCRCTSNPARLARPLVAGSSVARMLMVVVLPAPFGPRKPKISPSATWNRFVTALNSQNLDQRLDFDDDGHNDPPWIGSLTLDGLKTPSYLELKDSDLAPGIRSVLENRPFVIDADRTGAVPFGIRHRSSVAVSGADPGEKSCNSTLSSTGVTACNSLAKIVHAGVLSFASSGRRRFPHRSRRRLRPPHVGPI